MNAIGKLIKTKIISFIEVLIENYKELGISEVDAVILAKLYYLGEKENHFLSIKDLVSGMNIPEVELSNRILNLVSMGYIELTVNEDGKETFSLDGIIEKIGEFLNQDNVQEDTDTKETLVASIVNYIESTYGRMCSASDLIIINDWVDRKYSIDDIKTAILQSLKAKKMHLKYADAILATRNTKRTKIETEVDPELKELLDNAYVKKR